MLLVSGFAKPRTAHAPSIKTILKNALKIKQNIFSKLKNLTLTKNSRNYKLFSSFPSSLYRVIDFPNPHSSTFLNPHTSKKVPPNIPNIPRQIFDQSYCQNQKNNHKSSPSKDRLQTLNQFFLCIFPCFIASKIKIPICFFLFPHTHVAKQTPNFLHSPLPAYFTSIRAQGVCVCTVSQHIS